MRFRACWIFFLVLPTALAQEAVERGAGLPNPVLFVTQVPIPADFATIGSTFANHSARIDKVGRGGDLYVRYPDGSLRNLTREAGYGEAGVFQGASAIAVRDPSVHWDGARALFSMAIGAPPVQYEWTTEYWQIYEVTGLGQGETAAVTKVANQPEDFNNITPLYAPDGRIVFTSDRPRGGERHLYPQHDEYESTATNTGLWSLDAASGDLRLLQHAPSGSFTPILDSFGRVIFTRWDHLQRDQQADADALEGDVHGTFDYSHEGPGSVPLATREEVFPEPRGERVDLLAGTNLEGHTLNHFFPWQIRPDGSEEETLNHIGRHELHTYFNRVFNDDPNLVEFIDSVSGRTNPNPIQNLFQIAEDPTQPGRYLGVEAPEFSTHASGQIVGLGGPPGLAADEMVVVYLTHPETATVVGEGQTPPAEHSGHYREPLPLADGSLVAVHTAETRAAANEGSRAFPQPRYDFRLKLLAENGAGYQVAGTPLTGGIVRRVEYWDPDVLVTWDGPLWELSPVEVRPRPAPPLLIAPVLQAPELAIFAEEEVDPEVLRSDLRQRGLALIISRDVTTRDAADRQQPFNLRVAGGGTQTLGAGGRVYDVAFLQLFQADQLRGIGGPASPAPGRRVLARVMHDPQLDNPPAPDGPPGSVAIAADGSLAAEVPARRALSWQLTDPDATPVVRERNWLTFQPGEIRLCASCHGLNSVDQAGEGEPQNSPEALRAFLQHWKSSRAAIFADGFESGGTGAWSPNPP